MCICLGYKLIEKLQQRQCFRAEIVKEEFTVEKNKRVFFALKNITKELQELYEQYRREFKTRFEWREIELEEVSSGVGSCRF